MSVPFAIALAACAGPAEAWARREALLARAIDGADHQALAAAAVQAGGGAAPWPLVLTWIETLLQRLPLDPAAQRCLDRACEVAHRAIGDRPRHERRACADEREALRLALASAQALATIRPREALADLATAVLIAHDLPADDPLRLLLAAVSRELQ